MRSEIAAENRTAANSTLTEDDIDKWKSKLSKQSKTDRIAENISIVIFTAAGILEAVFLDWLVLSWIIVALLLIFEKRKWRILTANTSDLLLRSTDIIRAQRELIQHFDNNYTPNFLEKSPSKSH
jgi:hypothetical protein